MTRSEVKEIIISILGKDILQRELKEVEDTEPLGENGLGIDSLNFLKLLTKLEKAFDIAIEDEYWDYRRMSSVKDLIEYFYQRQ